MARIISYKYDLNITDGDAWIGTDAKSLSTRQFTAAALAEYLNVSGKVSIAGQMSYEYVVNEFGGLGTFSLPGGGLQNISFNSITSFTISEIDLAGQNVVAFMNYLVGSSILIASQADIGNFGHYKITGYSTNSTNASYYDLELEIIGYNGVLLIDKIYNLASFVISDGDKTFVFDQITPSNTWNITHTLNKFPSVSVVDTAGTQVFTDVNYINNNNITLTFSTGFAGKAFLN